MEPYSTVLDTIWLYSFRSVIERKPPSRGIPTIKTLSPAFTPSKFQLIKDCASIQLRPLLYTDLRIPVGPFLSEYERGLWISAISYFIWSFFHWASFNTSLLLFFTAVISYLTPHKTSGSSKHGYFSCAEVPHVPFFGVPYSVSKI